MTKLREYEVTFIIQSELEDDKRQELIEKLTQTLTHGEEEESAPSVDLWGRRQLAYPIKRNTDGYYVYAEAQLDPHRIRTIERSLNYDENILRYLFVRKES